MELTLDLNRHHDQQRILSEVVVEISVWVLSWKKLQLDWKRDQALKTKTKRKRKWLYWISDWSSFHLKIDQLLCSDVLELDRFDQWTNKDVQGILEVSILIKQRRLHALIANKL